MRGTLALYEAPAASNFRVRYTPSYQMLHSNDIKMQGTVGDGRGEVGKRGGEGDGAMASMRTSMRNFAL